VVKDNSIDEVVQYTFLGHRRPNVPRNAGSFWCKWDVKEIAELDGLSLGIGVRFVGERHGDPISSFQPPAHTRLDAMAAYRWKSDRPI
jgi:iron complex outermembrane receptor protein